MNSDLQLGLQQIRSDFKQYLYSYQQKHIMINLNQNKNQYDLIIITEELCSF